MPPISAVLLAAGSSGRMGRLKQLLPFADRPAVNCCLDAIRSAGISDIVAVLSAGADEIRQAIGSEARIVINHQAGSQMADSVRVGLEAVSPSAEAVLICLADHPLVSSDTMRLIVARQPHHPGGIIVPTYRGRRGHPTLFPRKVLAGVFSGQNLRKIIADHESLVDLLAVEDEGIILDMDTEDDYKRMSAHYGA